MALTVVTPAAAEPITLADVKAHLRVTHTADDTAIALYQVSARDALEQLLGRVLQTTTFDWTLDAWPAVSWLAVPRSPLVSVTSITYYDPANTAATWAAANYFVDTTSDQGRIALAYGVTWPTTSLRPVNGIIVRYVGGYGTTPASVPAAIRTAILLLTAAAYEQRQPTLASQVQQILPLGIWEALSHYRVSWGVA